MLSKKNLDFAIASFFILFLSLSIVAFAGTASPAASGTIGQSVEWKLESDLPVSKIYALASFDNKLWAGVDGALLDYDKTPRDRDTRLPEGWRYKITTDVNDPYSSGYTALTVYDNKLYVGASDRIGLYEIKPGNTYAEPLQSRKFLLLEKEVGRSGITSFVRHYVYHNYGGTYGYLKDPALYAGGYTPHPDVRGLVFINIGEEQGGRTFDSYHFKSAVKSLAVYNDKLYIALADGRVWKQYEYGPQIADSPEPFSSMTGGTGPLSNSGAAVLALTVYNNKLYAGTGDGKIFVNDGSTSPGSQSPIWTLSADLKESGVKPFIEYKNKLYAGTSPNGKIYQFDGNSWTMVADLPENDIYSFAIYDNKLYVGTGPNGKLYSLTEIPTYTLTVSKSGTGSGTVTATGINCPTDCSESYNSGTPVTLTAAPSSGSTFGGWGGACSGTTASCTVTIDAVKTVTATFTTAAVADTTKPTVTALTHSPTSPKVGDPITFTATASDNVGVTQIKIWIDDVAKKTCTSSPCTYSTSYTTADSHWYIATAYDNAQNTGRNPEGTGTKSFIVSAATQQLPTGTSTTVNLGTGWNLISIPGDFSAATTTCSNPTIYFFDANTQQYSNAKTFDGIKNTPADVQTGKRTSWWAYAPSACSITYSVINYQTSTGIPVKQGWNFLPITNDMSGKKLDDIKGSCGLSVAYRFNTAANNWVSLPLTANFGNTDRFNGMIVYSNNACTLQ